MFSEGSASALMDKKKTPSNNKPAIKKLFGRK
jgi:hypothetical protein